MLKNERKCWHCGSKNLAPDGRGVRCGDCGATWNKVPGVGSFPYKDTLHDEFGKTERHVSGTIARKVARQRRLITETPPKE